MLSCFTYIRQRVPHNRDHQLIYYLSSMTLTLIFSGLLLSLICWISLSDTICRKKGKKGGGSSVTSCYEFIYTVSYLTWHIQSSATSTPTSTSSLRICSSYHHHSCYWRRLLLMDMIILLAYHDCILLIDCICVLCVGVLITCNCIDYDTISWYQL